MAAIEQIRATIEQGDERAARGALRAQIARLEREHAAIVSRACPRLDVVSAGHERSRTGDDSSRGGQDSSRAGPRLLSLGDLERARDALAGRVVAAHAAAEAQAARQADARRELERMLADPPAHRWRRLGNADLGLPGCTSYHVRPRAGLLGMLMGWWEVKVSGGCP
jgi:hypothetical protein